MGKAFKIEVNRVNEDNVRIHKQCEQIDSLIGEEQISLIVLGEYQTEEAGIRCRATTVLHIDKTHGAIALATALFDNMRQNEQLCDIIFAAAALYEEHEQQMSDRLELN